MYNPSPVPCTAEEIQENSIQWFAVTAFRDDFKLPSEVALLKDIVAADYWNGPLKSWTENLAAAASNEILTREHQAVTSSDQYNV